MNTLSNMQHAELSEIVLEKTIADYGDADSLLSELTHGNALSLLQLISMASTYMIEGDEISDKEFQSRKIASDHEIQKLAQRYNEIAYQHHLEQSPESKAA